MKCKTNNNDSYLNKIQKSLMFNFQLQAQTRCLIKNIFGPTKFHCHC